MKRRRWRWAVATCVGAVLLLDTGAWWWTERALGRLIEQWRAAMAGSGWIVTLGDAAPGGWPFGASRALTGVTLRGGTASLRIDRAVLRLSPLQPNALVIVLPGETAARLPGLPAMHARAETWTVQVTPDGAAAVDTTGMQVDVTLPDPAAPGTASPRLTIALGHLQITPASGGDMRFVGSAQSIGLPAPPGESLPLGPRIASIAFDVTLHGAVPPPFLAARALAAWRGHGGALDVSRFALGYGPLGVSGQGRFDLDPALQPRGRAALHLVGQSETVAALAAGHVISSHVALAADAVLALLARTPPGGGAPQVDTSLALQDDILTAAGFPLLRLPPIGWPP